jgi:RNA-directed DNA polymerase
MPERIVLLNRFLTGWSGYFALADTPWVFRDLDGWLRRRLRQVRWKEWKRRRTRLRNLLALGMPRREAFEWAGSGKGSWRVAGSFLNRGLPNAYWADLGLKGLSPTYVRLRSTW